MEKIIGLKNFRENLGEYAREVKRGRSFIVMKRSIPLFKMVPIDDEEDEGLWEEVIDFTKIKKGGVAIEDLLSRL